MLCHAMSWLPVAWRFLSSHVEVFGILKLERLASHAAHPFFITLLVLGEWRWLGYASSSGKAVYRKGGFKSSAGPLV